MSGLPHGGTEREGFAAEIAARGRMAWQQEHGYGKRASVEIAVFRLERGGAERLTACTFGAWKREVAFRVSAANEAIRLAKPAMIRIV